MRFLLTCVLASCVTIVQAQSPEQFGVTTLTPPTLQPAPRPIYWPRMRMWQGIPSIERTANGRLWATWFCGPLIEGARGYGNYAVLVTSEDDGKTWSKPVAVYDATPFFGGITLDPHLWIDPAGRMWWFVNRNLAVPDANGTFSVWGFCTDNAEVASPTWKAPVFAGYGSALNKPIVLSDGEWLRPVDTFDPNDPERTRFYVSRDQGKTFHFLSKTPIKDGSFSELMAVERRDGSLLALSRTTYGIAQIESFDRGTTWKNDRPLTKQRGVNARFHLRRLKSGALLLVLNDHPKSRTNMTAMLSEDEGKTWPHKLLLDGRALVSYPDGVEGSNGFLYVIYDRGRYVKGAQEILMAKITEADIKAGKLVNPDSRLRVVVNRLADHGGGVHVTNETKRMLKEYEKELDAKRRGRD
ncbi:MAG: exo-alpha-sialidase [Pirellulales bacterium]|nr:exo-alpha-sialidase [Pirellulales bacterium]